MSRAAPDEPRRLRLFVACALPPAVRQALEEWQRRELGRRDDLRIVAPPHLTLAFLGDVDADRVPELEGVLASVTWSAAEAGFKGPVFLPARGRRRVVALELEDATGSLRDLQAAVSSRLADAGLYEPEKRRWLPHVTVARFRRPGHPFSLQNVNIGQFCLVRMVLYSSHLEPTGAVHTPLADFPAS